MCLPLERAGYSPTQESKVKYFWVIWRIPGKYGFRRVTSSDITQTCPLKRRAPVRVIDHGRYHTWALDPSVSTFYEARKFESMMEGDWLDTHTHIHAKIPLDIFSIHFQSRPQPACRQWEDVGCPSVYPSIFPAETRQKRETTNRRADSRIFMLYNLPRCLWIPRLLSG